MGRRNSKKHLIPGIGESSIPALAHLGDDSATVLWRSASPQCSESPAEIPLRMSVSSLHSEERCPTAFRLAGDKDVGEIPGVFFSKEEIESFAGWSFVGFILGRFPGRIAVNLIVKSWNVSCSTRLLSSGWIQFYFDEKASKAIVVSKMPFFMFGKTLYAKALPDSLILDEEELKSIPLWTKLPNLPRDLWNLEALSNVLSAVGKPVYMDEKTTMRSNLSYARVLVEVDLSQSILRTISITLASGESLSVPVIFENEPLFCSSCSHIGHAESGCFKNKSMPPAARPKPQLDRKSGGRTENSAIPPPGPAGKTPTPANPNKARGWFLEHNASNFPPLSLPGKGPSATPVAGPINTMSNPLPSTSHTTASSSNNPLFPSQTPWTHILTSSGAGPPPSSNDTLVMEC